MVMKIKEIRLKQEFMNSSMATTESHFSMSDLRMYYNYGILRIHMTYCIMYVNNYEMTTQSNSRKLRVSWISLCSIATCRVQGDQSLLQQGVQHRH